MTSPAAHAQIDAQSIVEGCHDVVRASRGLAPQGRGETASECLGAVTAVAEGLSMLHARYYAVRYPNLSYPLKDMTTANALVADALLFGPNVCFPA
jgi:hypothetical protein